MTRRFRLTSSLTDLDMDDKALKDYYKSWRSINQKSKAPFLTLDKHFFNDKLLRDLESGPLRLYLYFSYVANNDYGNSWHSIQTIADYFGSQTRTVDNWIKVLVDKGLIFRAQKGNKSHTTYLLPFSDTLVVHPAPKKRVTDDQALLDDLLKKIKELEFIYGQIILVHHLFQWTYQSKEKKVTRDSSVQMLLIITKRKNDVLIGHIHFLRKSDNLSVSELEIEEHSIFESPFIFDGNNVTGVALTSYPSVKSSAALRDLIDLVNELASIESWKLEDRPRLNYGIKDELIPVPEIEDEADEDDEGDEDNREKD